MRRDYFTVTVTTTDETDSPTIRVEYDGPSELLSERLTGPSGDRLTDGDIDVTYRLKGDEGTEDGDQETGVLSVGNRYTGDFVLEANVPADGLLDALTAAREAEDDAGYSLEIDVVDGGSLTYEKQTLLVYDADGSLLRQESLIPGGVEL